MTDIRKMGKIVISAGEEAVKSVVSPKPQVAGAAAQELVSSVLSKDASKAASTIGKSMVKTASNTVSDSSARWSKPAKEYIPTVIKGTKDAQIPFHHEVNGENCNIRSVLDGIKLGHLTEYEEDNLPFALKSMYKNDRAFAQLPPLEKDCIAYRGRGKHPFIARLNTDFDIIQKAKPGDVIVPDTGYSYLGFERSLANNWCPDYDPKCESIMYTIRLPKGAKVSRNLEHGGEVLMPRGAEYKLISKSTEDNHTEVVLEYILPTKDNVAEIEALAKKFNVELPE